MATASTIFGLTDEQDPKKRMALQSGQISIGDSGTSSDLSIPTAQFSNLPKIQQVAASIVGQAPSIRAAQLPANFSFTGKYEAANRGLQQEESDAGLARRNQLANIDEQYQRAQTKSSDLRDIAYKQLVESMASRGLGASGIHAQEQAKLEKNYNDYLNELAYSRGQALSGVEGSYASILNDIARRREGLFGEQQAAEEERRLREEQAKAAAEAQRQQAEQQQKMLEQIAQAQEAARRAAEAASAARAMPVYTPVSIGSGGGGGYSAPEPQAPEPQQNPTLITLPPFGQGAQQADVKNWIVNNVDRNLANNPIALDAVFQALLKNRSGLTTAQISAIINNVGYGTPGVF